MHRLADLRSLLVSFSAVVSAVPDYLDVVKEPVDLSTIEKRIRQDNYYKSKQMLFADLMLMVNNCKLYNEDGSTYVQCAISVEKMLGALFHDIGLGKV